MTAPPENPPAFPRDTTAETPNGLIRFDGPEGMELRDYFAAKAMQGLLASMPEEKWADRASGVTGFAYLTAAAYSCADAMLAERTKPDGK